MSAGPTGAEVVLVTDGEARAALAATRSLGRRGYEVHVASADGRSLAGSSRYAREDHALGDPGADPREWSERLAALVQRLAAAAVLPVSEVSLGSCYRFGLDRDPRVICPPRECYERAVDK
ncbi:MAG TPA: hypothetical protein VHQ66_06600, partial [Myxococcota bacterium]|nr:hypothetical protein [Myxococcota bacterium]